MGGVPWMYRQAGTRSWRDGTGRVLGTAQAARNGHRPTEPQEPLDTTQGCRVGISGQAQKAHLDG